jgi:hypothetical protein
MQTPFNYGVSMGMQVYRTSSCMASDSSCVSYPLLPALGTSGLNFVRNYGSLALVAATINAVQSFDLYEQQYGCNSGLTSGPTMIDVCSSVQGVAVTWQPNADGTANTLTETRTISRLDDSTQQTVVQTSSQPVTWWSPGPGVAPIAGNDLSSIYSQLTQASLNQSLDPSTLAALTNQTWQQAAGQPGYQGLPYTVSQPIGLSDAQAWQLANPSAMPHVGDLFTPASDPGVSTVSIDPAVQPGQASSSNPASSPAISPGNDVNVVNTPNVNVVNKVTVDFGSDPAVPSPTLEATPTISMILSPLLNLLPDLKHWTVPAHSAVCPEPSFTVLGHSFTLTTQCDLAESNRAAIYTAFAAMFTLAALFVVLRA